MEGQSLLRVMITVEQLRAAMVMEITMAIKLNLPQTEMETTPAIIQQHEDQDMDNQTTMVGQVSLHPTREVKVDKDEIENVLLSLIKTS